jgi:hypothetical protein
MGMRLVEGALLHEHLFGAVADDVRRLLHLSYKEMADRVDIDPDRIRSFRTKGIRVTRVEFRDKIFTLAQEAGDAALSAYLECKYPELFGTSPPPPLPVDVALAHWLGTRDQSRTAFYDNCIRDSQGRFLLMRRDDEGRVICARMRVSAPAGPDSLPTFATFRFLENGDRRTTQGFIFELHGRIYTIGQLDNLQGLRFANLQIRQRRDRNDLFGIRLGILGSGLTFASRIYAYQFKASARLVRSHPRVFRDILKPWHPDRSPDLAAAIPGFRAVYALLEPGPLVDNGLAVGA